MEVPAHTASNTAATATATVAKPSAADSDDSDDVVLVAETPAPVPTVATLVTNVKRTARKSKSINKEAIRKEKEMLAEWKAAEVPPIRTYSGKGRGSPSPGSPIPALLSPRPTSPALNTADSDLTVKDINEPGVITLPLLLTAPLSPKNPISGSKKQKPTSGQHAASSHKQSEINTLAAQLKPTTHLFSPITARVDNKSNTKQQNSLSNKSANNATTTTGKHTLVNLHSVAPIKPVHTLTTSKTGPNNTVTLPSVSHPIEKRQRDKSDATSVDHSLKKSLLVAKSVNSASNSPSTERMDSSKTVASASKSGEGNRAKIVGLPAPDKSLHKKPAGEIDTGLPKTISDKIPTTVSHINTGLARTKSGALPAPVSKASLVSVQQPASKTSVPSKSSGLKEVQSDTATKKPEYVACLDKSAGEASSVVKPATKPATDQPKTSANLTIKLADYKLKTSEKPTTKPTVVDKSNAADKTTPNFTVNNHALPKYSKIQQAASNTPTIFDQLTNRLTAEKQKEKPAGLLNIVSKPVAPADKPTPSDITKVVNTPRIVKQLTNSTYAEKHTSSSNTSVNASSITSGNVGKKPEYIEGFAKVSSPSAVKTGDNSVIDKPTGYDSTGKIVIPNDSQINKTSESKVITKPVSPVIELSRNGKPSQTSTDGEPTPEFLSVSQGSPKAEQASAQSPTKTPSVNNTAQSISEEPDKLNTKIRISGGKIVKLDENSYKALANDDVKSDVTGRKSSTTVRSAFQSSDLDNILLEAGFDESSNRVKSMTKDQERIATWNNSIKVYEEYGEIRRKEATRLLHKGLI